MGSLCNWVSGLAGLFLLSALIVALAETALLLFLKWQSLQQQPKAGFAGAESLEGLAKVIDAFKGLLLALKDLPAWIALFLAGLALVWTASSAPHLCT